MNFGMLGAAIVMGIAAIGSAIGIGTAGQGAIGAWKRCYLNNKPAPFPAIHVCHALAVLL